MRFIFFIALIFIIVEIGISSYLVYDLHCKNDEEIKNLEKQDVKTIVTLRKVVVLDNLISLKRLKKQIWIKKFYIFVII